MFILRIHSKFTLANQAIAYTVRREFDNFFAKVVNLWDQDIWKKQHYNIKKNLLSNVSTKYTVSHIYSFPNDCHYTVLPDRNGTLTR